MRPLKRMQRGRVQGLCPATPSLAKRSEEGGRKQHRRRRCGHSEGEDQRCGVTSMQVVFLVTIATNSHNPATYSDTDLFSYGSGCQKSKRNQQSCIPSEGSRGESISLSFPMSRGCLPGLVAPSSKANIFQCLSLLPSPYCLLLTLTPPPPSYTDPCVYTGPVQIIQQKLPVSHPHLNHIGKVPLALYLSMFTGSRD